MSRPGRFKGVRIAGVAHHLPDEVVTSEALEEQLSELYERLGVRVGRLELMTGIRERRFWPAGTRPSEVAARAGRLALDESGLEPASIGLVVHASVCRDFLEPATASIVHHRLGLPPECAAFDLSNACLGFANAMAVVARQIESGAIEAGLVVAGEDGRSLVEETLRDLRGPQAGRAELKAAFASLTIGAGAAAMVLAREDRVAPDTPELVGAVSRSATEHHALCWGDRRPGGEGPLMETDSEGLLIAGNRLASRTWRDFLDELGWTPGDVDRVVTHQVGVAHRRMLLETLEIDERIDFPTVESLGNIGSVSLPLCFSMGRAEGFLQNGQRVALLGIGSGLQCQMLGVQC